MSKALWFAVYIPNVGDDADQDDAEMMADGLVAIVNEERARNALAGAGTYERVSVELWPPPQWVTAEQVREYAEICRSRRQGP